MTYSFLCRRFACVDEKKSILTMKSTGISNNYFFNTDVAGISKEWRISLKYASISKVMRTSSLIMPKKVI